jgi:hypothetical protein
VHGAPHATRLVQTIAGIQYLSGEKRIRIARMTLFAFARVQCSGKAIADNPALAAADNEKVIYLEPDLNGTELTTTA